MTQNMKTELYKMLQNMNLCSWRIALRCILVMLMMVAGVGETWGQTPDYSGVYYIASGGKSSANGSSYTYNSSTPANNFYLCPTEGWCYYKPTDDYSNDGTTYPNPFLTTYKCMDGVYDATKAVWIIQKAPSSNYYYIIQKKTGKYLVSNGQINTTTNPDRIRVHLESIANPTTQGDKVLFDISIPDGKTYFVISPKGITDGHDLDHDGADHTTHRWLSVNFGNYNYLTGQSGKGGGPTNYTNVAGIVCIYTKSDVNAPFYFEPLPVAAPTFTVDATGVTINHEEGTTVRYTIDDSDPTTSTGIVYDDSHITDFSGMTGTAIKAIAIRTLGNTPSAVASVPLNEARPVAVPTFTVNASGYVTIHHEEGTTVRYTTDGTDPTISTGTVYDDNPISGVSAMTGSAIKAIAIRTSVNKPSVTASLSLVTPIYNIVDTQGRIAIKCTAAKCAVGTPFSGYASIPEAIRSPYIADETITFYDSFTEGDLTSLGTPITSVPLTSNIYVTYTTTHLADKPVKLAGGDAMILQVNGEYVYDNSGSFGHTSSETDKNARSHLWKLLGNDPYRVQIQNVETAGHCFLWSTSPSATLSLGAGGSASSYFILMGGSVTRPDNVPSGWDDQLELMAATGTDAATAYYNVGYDSSVGLLASSSYGHADAAVQLLFDKAELTSKYHLIDLSGHIVLEASHTSSTLSLPTQMTSPLVSAYHYYTADDFTVSEGVYTLKDSPAPTELSGLLDATDGHIYVTYDVSTTSLMLNGTAAYWMKVNGNYAYYSEYPAVISTADAYGATLSYVWTFDAGGDPYQVKVKNLMHNQYLHYDTPASDEPTVDLNQSLQASAQKFFLRSGAAAGKYELVALTATPLDLDTSPTTYAVGDGGSDDLKLYASTTYATGNAHLQVEFEVSTRSCTFVILNHNSEETISSSEIDVAPGDLLSPLLPAAIKSPLAKDWRFYKSKVEASTDFEADRKTSLTAADMMDLVDSKIFVRYTTLEPGDAGYVDLNGRSHGNMYLMSFANGESFKQEAGDDNVQGSPTKAIYLYNNGDYNLYIYGDAQWSVARDGAASTRTRFPWFLESDEYNPDPYNVRIGSYQTQGSDTPPAGSGIEPTLYHAYLRTYVVSYGTPATNHVVTGVITDNTEIDDGSEPTTYMILGTPGAFKLVTFDPIDDGTTNVQRTVDSFEQYWKTYETISQSGEYSPNEITNPAFAGVSLHSYEAWANARPEAGGSKRFCKENHWFQTVRMDYNTSTGDYTAEPVFNFVPLVFEGALILLDNHGWEVMRMPIVKDTETARNAETRAALKKYDSRMVERYHFFTDTKGAAKLPGYHKYKIDPAQEVGTDRTITSLSDFPQALDASGTIYDLYVTYDVVPAFAEGYVGAATEAEVQAAKYIIYQGNHYSHATSSTSAESVSVLPANVQDTSGAYDDYYWRMIPNFNIDDEMGYQYDLDADGKLASETGRPALTKAEIDAAYHAAGKSGFDPYNIRIQSAKYNTFATTNATTATLTSGAWSGNGTSLTLTTGTDTFDADSYDGKTCAVTNTVFMVICDAYGNSRVMPRFDHNQVMTDFMNLAAQDNIGSFNPIHRQSTSVFLPITYHIVRQGTTREVYTTAILQAKGSAFSLPNRNQLDDRLNCTLSNNYYRNINCAVADQVTIVGEGGINIYVPYTFDAATLAENTHIMFSESGTDPIWMALRFVNDDDKYLSYDDGSHKIVKGDDTPDDDADYFAFIGDPYQFQIINRADAADGMDAQAAAGALNFNTHSDEADYTWSLIGPSGEGTAKFQIMLTSTSNGTRSFWESASPVVLYSGDQHAAGDLLAELEQVMIPVLADNGRDGITLSCLTDGAVIHYVTGTTTPADPTDESATYSTPLTNVEGKTVKAIAVKYGMRDSEVLTKIIVLHPTITLSPTSYTYDKTAKEPSVTATYGDPETTIPAAEYDVAYSNNTNAGTATVTLANISGDYYVKGSTTFTINPAVFTVTADPQTKVYGDPDPALTYVSSGLVAGDNLADVLTGALSRVAGENARTTYDITQGSLAVNSNYSIDYTGALLTITPKAIGDDTDPATNFSINIDKRENGTYPVIVWQGAKALVEGPAVDDGTAYDYYLTTDDSDPKYHVVTVHGVKNYDRSFTAKYANVTFSKLEGSLIPGGAATFITNATGDFDFAVPLDMNAYIVTGINLEARSVVLTHLDYIPENVPILLLSDYDALGFQVKARSGGTDITPAQEAANKLKKASVDTYFNTATIYLLYKGEFVLNTRGTLPAGKIYLDPALAGGGAPARLRIEWEDDLTGIESIPLPTSDASEPEVWYSLDGRRLSGRPTQKGIYIRNGKKVCL